MWALAVETTQNLGSLALFKNKTLVDSLEWRREHSHSEYVTVALTQILEKNQVAISDIDRYAVGIGPGSFTGIRVGVNLVRSLAYVFKKPIYCMSSLELLASQAKAMPDVGLKNIYAVQYAFRDLYYFQNFTNQDGELSPAKAALALTQNDIHSAVETEGLAMGTAFLDEGPEPSTPWTTLFKKDDRLSNEVRARFFLYTRFLDEGTDIFLEWKDVAPLYIRASEAEEKLRRGLLKSL